MTSYNGTGNGPTPTPAAPPARPHSAHRQMSLPSGGLFRVSSGGQRPARAPKARSKEPEWEDEDAWDASSDKSDEGAGPSGILRTRGARPASILSGISGIGASYASSSRASSVRPASISSSTRAPSPPSRRTPMAASSRASPERTGSPEAMERPAPIPIVGARTQQASEEACGSISTSWVAASYRPDGDVPPGYQPLQVEVEARSLTTGGTWELVESKDADDSPPTPVGAEALRPDAEDVVKGEYTAAVKEGSLGMQRHLQNPERRLPPRRGYPLLALSALSLTEPSSPGIRSPAVSRQRSVRTERRRDKCMRILKGNTANGNGAGSIDLGALKSFAWGGVPAELRPIVWQLLLNYLPLPEAPRLATLTRKRREYAQFVQQYFGTGDGAGAALDQQMWHQIEIDVPRTRPGVALWSCPTTQRALERILYVWAIRHPASGYVQGINDLATPFFEVFLSAYVSVDPELFDVSTLPEPVLAAVEADSFWCLTKLLDGIQDHYIREQPGIQRLVSRMGSLIKRVDPELAAHFEAQGVQYMQFAFRWMNCLLMRELSVKCTVRMWDTYLAEGPDSFSTFHLYVCSALLCKFSRELKSMDFQEIIMFLQSLSNTTKGWGDKEIELLLSEAFVLKNTWHGADNHFANQVNGGNDFGMMGR